MLYCIYGTLLQFLLELPIEYYEDIELKSIQYSILLQRALLNINIVNIPQICTRICPLELQYELW
jgi:hypothetical protein